MARKVFVDTSCWIAVADKSERFHKTAARIYKDLLRGPSLLVTSDLVVAETQILLRRRLSAEAATIFLDSVNNSPTIDLVFLDSESELAAKQLLRKFSDQDLSFTDAVSFVIMNTRRIKTAFTLDRHFALGGFKILP